MQIGFGKEAFFDLLKPRFNSGFSEITLADELSIIAMVANEGSTTVVLIVADCESFGPAVAAEIRQKLASQLALPIHHISLFATQNHCAPLFPVDATNQVVALCAKAARQGITSLQPAEMLQVTVHPDPALNFCRRVVVPELGAFTFWSGYRELKPGQADVGALMDLSLRNVARGEPPVRHQSIPPGQPMPAGKEVVLLPRAADDALQALFFRTPAGAPIGCFLRFAAHPCTGERPATYSQYSGDFPVYARRKLEREFGGMAAFLTGPCGDANPLIERRSQALAQSFGEQIATEVLRALRPGKWIQPGRLAACEVNVQLPVR
ncbi:MAG TPA: hypothetical protein VL860_13095, partial [Planctomycetota bacterium]|nr:hypothetical protein [Planctomycetota bacterium]